MYDLPMKSRLDFQKPKWVDKFFKTTFNLLSFPSCKVYKNLKLFVLDWQLSHL